MRTVWKASGPPRPCPRILSFVFCYLLYVAYCCGLFCCFACSVRPLLHCIPLYAVLTLTRKSCIDVALQRNDGKRLLERALQKPLSSGSGGLAFAHPRETRKRPAGSFFVQYVLTSCIFTGSPRSGSYLKLKERNPPQGRQHPRNSTWPQSRDAALGRGQAAADLVLITIIMIITIITITIVVTTIWIVTIQIIITINNNNNNNNNNTTTNNNNNNSSKPQLGRGQAAADGVLGRVLGGSGKIRRISHYCELCHH